MARATAPPPMSWRPNHVRTGPPAARQAAKPSGRIGGQPLAPLPTREENEREFEEIAAKMRTEKDSEFENRNSEIRAQRLEEQLKFRDELRELLKTKGMQAGPDIATLKQRYDYEVDPLKWEQAKDSWRFSKTTSFRDKVKLVRSLELPETAILELMCSSIDKLIGTRSGPRDTNEVWVRAARQLLLCELPRMQPGGPPAVVAEGAAVRPAAVGAGTAAPPTRKTVVSTPR